MSYVILSTILLGIGLALGWELRIKLEPWFNATIHITRSA